MTIKPVIPKGTRDFSPEEIMRRDYIFDTIRQVFRLYGYQPIETPAMENLSTLLGKYGEEGDRLIYRILNSGDFLSNLDDASLSGSDLSRISSLICEKGLRYDLTVPFARYVVQHRDEIVFPFKRYQIQPVWRADRPQKGRYREFFQCDVDVIGSDSLLNEYELIQIIDDIFGKLKLAVKVKVNNRKVVAAIAEYIGEASRITDITVAVDKLEKIGLDAVNKELEARGLSQEAVSRLQPLMKLTGNTKKKLKQLEEIFSGSEPGERGIEELRMLFSYLENGRLSCETELDITLARGLDYYTGSIIEVKSKDVDIGSLCGGGRYDDLTGIFGLDGISGVGISFGADRIYDVMNRLNLFGERNKYGTQVLILNFEKEEVTFATKLRGILSQFQIRTELYPDNVKLKKQMSYADSNKIPYVILAGEDEIKNKTVVIKIMSTGEQKRIPLSNFREFIESVIKQQGLTTGI